MKEALANLAWKCGLYCFNRVVQSGIGSKALLGAPIANHMYRLAHRLIPAPSGETRVRLPEGYWLAIPPGHQTARSFASGMYEPETSEALRRLVQHGMAVVDVGAHIGYHTLLLADLVGPAGRVYALEPDPHHCAWLRRNVAENGFTQVKVLQIAASNQNGKISFFSDKQSGESRLSIPAPQMVEVSVEAVRLDELFAGFGWPPVDLVKMDIEGHEASALEGMQELSRRNPHLRLIIEYASDKMAYAGVTSQELGQRLLELGFGTVYVLTDPKRGRPLPHGLERMPPGADLLCVKAGEAAQA